MTHSFPTRRSSDLLGGIGNGFGEFGLTARASVVGRGSEALGGIGRRRDGHGGNCQAAPVVRPRWRRIFVLPVRQCRRWQHAALEIRSEEHTSELQSLMRISYAVFCLKKKIT